MDKIVRFESVDNLGRCFAEALDITRRGAGLEKIAGQTHPEISSYLKTLRPDPKYQYVLMTPMGSYEYWGMNVNGDVFPDISLAFNREKDDPIPVVRSLEDRWLSPFQGKVPPGNYTNFGHKTFLEALRYRHHVNKNPEIAYGDITLSVWNPAMHRVEVISRHDRERAKRVGAEEIIIDLDAGKPRQISMGCRVPFDVCTLCGHISKTPGDYCDHLRTMMGSITPEGRIVGAVNFFPKFFDLSDVFVPAAKESGVLLKVAHAGSPKVAALKTATQKKIADITKTILPNAGRKAVEDAMGCEPDMPQEVLREGDFSSLLSSLAAMGIVLKPREFQDGLLTRMGHRDLADDLWEGNQVFGPSGDCGCMDLGSRPDFGLMRALSPMLEDRSAFYPHLPQRILRVVVIRARPVPPPTQVSDSAGILKKVASVYGAYRQALRGLPQLLEVAVQTDPDYYHSNFFRDLLTDSLEKVSSSYHAMDLSTPLVPLYVYNAHRDGVVIPPAAWNFEVHHNSPVRALLSPVL